MNFHGFLFWIRNRKENKETGTICMKLRIPSKKPENNYGIIDEFFDGSDARQWAIIGWVAGSH